MAGLLCLFLLCLTLRAQTNASNPFTNGFVVITTNQVEAAPNFRLVNGQLYNTSLSKLWRPTSGTVQSKHRSVVIVETYESRSQRSAPALTGNQSIGASASSVRSDIGASYNTWKEYGKTIAITNLPNYSTLAEGSDIKAVDLMRAGTFETEGRTLELWDRGTVNRATVITTNRTAGLRPAATPER